MKVGIKINVKELIGNKNNRLTIIGEAAKLNNNKTRFLVRCDCGNEFDLVAHSFLSGRTSSCGCYRKETTKNRVEKHGLKKHPLYSIWSAMKERCYKSNHKSYLNYGAKGVKVCDEWLHNFKLYYDWCIKNGWKKRLHIDKDIIPEKLGIKPLIYSPEMCCIVTRQENNNHTIRSVVILHDGERYNLKQLTDKLNLKYKTVQERLINGWSIERALNAEIQKVK